MAIDLRTLALTALALLAFAANSLLCRLALAAGAIDAASFTAIRLLAGAIALGLLVRARSAAPTSLRPAGLWGPLALFAYAWLFSCAYLRIGAGVGALVLFSCVQLTMIGWGLWRGERPNLRTWIGLVLAAAGLVVLVAPSATQPDLLGIAQMAIAGVAWGVYSLLGRGTSDPLVANARSFLWSSPLALVVAFAVPASVPASARGVLLAIVSGAITSGLGYAIWYRALPRLTVSQAAVCQLSVPVVAALGAVLLLDEPLTMRLVIAGTAVLGGIGLALAARQRPPQRGA